MKLLENGLIPIYQNDKNETLVDARELHEFLEVQSRFNDWIRNRIEKYGFIENMDFLTLTKNLVTGGKQIDYVLKIDTAKEIAMVENNNQGRLARRYFIETEKKLKQLIRPQSIEDLIIMQANSVKLLKDEMSQARKEIAATTDAINEIKQTLIADCPRWRQDINSKIKKIGAKVGDYRRAWNESYQELERRAKCNLDRRLNNMLERMHSAGVPKKQRNDTGYLDVIAIDEKLKEIYTSVVKEMAIKYMD